MYHDPELRDHIAGGCLVMITLYAVCALVGYGAYWTWGLVFNG